MQDLRVIVIEDDLFTLSMICSALAQQGLDIVARGHTAATAMAAVSEFNPDALVIDLDLGQGPTGIDIAHAIRKRNLTIGLVVLTSYEDPRLLSPNIPELPNGTVYLVKKNIADVNRLVTAIRSSIDQVGFQIGLPSKQISSLTDIQVETLRLVAAGLTNQQIAKKREVSEKAVEQSLMRISKALGMEPGEGNNHRIALARKYYSLTGHTSSIVRGGKANTAK